MVHVHWITNTGETIAKLQDKVRLDRADKNEEAQSVSEQIEASI